MKVAKKQVDSKCFQDKKETLTMWNDQRINQNYGRNHTAI